MHVQNAMIINIKGPAAMIINIKGPAAMIINIKGPAASSVVHILTATCMAGI